MIYWQDELPRSSATLFATMCGSRSAALSAAGPGQPLGRSMLTPPAPCSSAGQPLRSGVRRGWVSGVLCGVLSTVLCATSPGYAAEKAAPDVSPQVLQAQKQRMAVMARAAEATVAIFGLDGGGGGSGVLVSPDGYALTNYHVSSACGDHMRCGLSDGRVYDAVIVGVDPTGDVSLIQLLGRDDFPTAPLADSDEVRVGHWCFSAGNPFVLATNLQPSISLGLVSGVGRYQYPAGTLLEYADCIQTDAAVNPGNSGGPLFNMQGEVIGINGRCSFEKRGRVNVGVGYAISANQIKKFLGMLKSGRLVDHATLGATVSTDSSGRVLVSNILNSSDAYRRGLRYGDEIVGLADREVRSTNNFKNILGTLPKDWRVPLMIRRDGNTQTLLVRLDGVHSEKQLIDLVNSESAQARKSSQPDPHKDPSQDPSQDPADELPQPPHDARQSPDEAEGHGELGESRQADAVTQPAGKLEPGQPNKALVESMLIQRPGFANYYYNQRHRDELWKQLRQQANFEGEAEAWTLSGTVAGETTPVAIDLTPERGLLHVGTRTLTAEATENISDVVSQRRETGLLVALRALQQMLLLGPQRIGDTVYLGMLPQYSGTATELAGAPLQPVLQTLWYDATVRFSFDSNTGLISLVEVFGDVGHDPVELHLDQYSPVAVSAKSVASAGAAASAADKSDESARKGPAQRLFPTRLRLQYGTEPRLLLSIDSVKLGTSVEAGAGPRGVPAAQPAAAPAQDAQSRRPRNSPHGSRKSYLVATQNAAPDTSDASDASDPSGKSAADASRASAAKLATTAVSATDANASLSSVAVATEMKVVKLYGAGGAANLQAYQSGFFISDAGHILTCWSTVLDVDTVFAVTSDGGRYEAKVLGIDPNLEIAILATGQATSHFFDLEQSFDPSAGSRVLAFSNLYGIATGSEMSSVQKGVIMARTELNARRGSFASIYQGPVLIIDAMTNNPGAAGGALTTFNGRLVGMLGKEMRDASANTWVNYAIPVSEMRESIARIISGKSIQRMAMTQQTVDRPTSLKDLGIVLIPNVLAKTPAFVDQVEPQSVAAVAGLRSDDLILFVNSQRVPSQATLLEELTTIDRADKLVLLVQRGNELQELILKP